MEIYLKSFQDKLAQIAAQIDARMSEYLQSAGGGIIEGAMRYMALAPGKRLRGALLLMIVEAFDKDRFEVALRVAVAVEMVHCYSLIHDDLPAMDNDDYRRGQLSCHKKFDEATAILAGDALLTYAFEILSAKVCDAEADLFLKIIRELSFAAGHRGMIAGQARDIAAIAKQLSIEERLGIHRAKTAALFSATCVIGGMIGGADARATELLRVYGTNLGLLFQIVDDVADQAQDENNDSLPLCFSIADLLKYASKFRAEMHSTLRQFDFDVGDLLQIMEYILRSLEEMNALEEVDEGWVGQDRIGR